MHITQLKQSYNGPLDFQQISQFLLVLQIKIVIFDVFDSH